MIGHFVPGYFGARFAEKWLANFQWKKNNQTIDIFNGVNGRK